MITVHCKECHNNFDEQDVEFVDIAEDMEGRDVLFFVCPECGKTVSSLRRGR